jgi:nitrite reductase (NADH) large subunit
VIINDSLGICEELEKEMKQFVDTYKCEWKEAVNTPEIRKRFKHFVNSDERDSTLQFKEERGQQIPVVWGNTQTIVTSSM